MSRRTIHSEEAEGVDYTLCGIADDAFESGDCEEKVFYAERPGQVNCPRCIAIIEFCRTRYSGVKFKRSTP